MGPDRNLENWTPKKTINYKSYNYLLLLINFTRDGNKRTLE